MDGKQFTTRFRGDDRDDPPEETRCAVFNCEDPAVTREMITIRGRFCTRNLCSKHAAEERHNETLWERGL